MRHLVLSKEPWLASIAGEAEPVLSGPDDPAALADRHEVTAPRWLALVRDIDRRDAWQDRIVDRSEEHTSELQSRGQLVCRLLLEKKKNIRIISRVHDSITR